MGDISKKNGLLYSDSFRILVGVDTSSDEFTGRIPFGAKSISDKAFAGVNYESISLPDSVKHVGFNLFENAAGVKSIRLPGALSELTPYMFAGCSSLEKINMPNIVPEFPEHIFEGCSSLKEVPFRTDIAYIGAFSFAKCSSIETIVFPETVQTIEASAFADCTSLESVVISSSVSTIADDAFSGCTAVNHIRLSESNNHFYIGDDGSLYRKSDDALIIKIFEMENQEVTFFETSEEIEADESANQNPQNNPVWIDETDDDEEDDTFSAEIGVGTDEEEELEMETPVADEPGESVEEPIVDELIESVEESVVEEPGESVEEPVVDEPIASVEEPVVEDTSSLCEQAEAVEFEPLVVENSSIESDNISISDVSDSQNEIIEEEQGEAPMDHEEMLASIMDQNTSTKSVDSSVSVNLDEIAGVVSAMNDTNGIYTEDMAKAKTKEKNLSILCNSVEYSLIKEYDTPGVPLIDPRLYVIVEKLVTDDTGKQSVSKKLMAFCENLVKIHDFKNVVFLSGLPFNNDEFVDFLSTMLTFQNVVVACEAASPSALSDYGKQACEAAGIRLDKADIAEQLKHASAKNKTIIKLVVQDKY